MTEHLKFEEIFNFCKVCNTESEMNLYAQKQKNKGKILMS